MTDAELDEIEARVRAATPGRWWCETGGLPGAWCLMAFIDDGEPKPVKAVLATRAPWEHRAEVSEATGVFIAHSREDVSALVAEVRRLRAGDSGRVRIRSGWMGEGRQGRRLGPDTHSGGQLWTPVLWDDEEDPTFHKATGIEVA